MKIAIPALLAAPLYLFSAWLFMLFVGVVHAAWLTMMPTIGFGSACLVVGVLWIPSVISAVISAVTD